MRPSRRWHLDPKRARSPQRARQRRQAKAWPSNDFPTRPQLDNDHGLGSATHTSITTRAPHVAGVTCLALLRWIHELAEQGSQFIIATHSPIVMSFPGALTYLLTEHGPKPVSWEDLDHVRITREFLNDPAIVLRDLLSES